MGANAQTTVPTFVASQVLTADQMNQSARTGIPVFASTVTRDAGFGGTGEKTLAEGQLCYVEGTGLQSYNGSSWVTWGAAPATSGLTLVSSTTIGTTVSSVTVTGAFSSTYENYAVIVSGGNASNGDTELRLTLGATATAYYWTSVSYLWANTANNKFGSNSTYYFMGYAQPTGGLSAQCFIGQPQIAGRSWFSSNAISLQTGGYSAYNAGYLNNATQYTDFTITTSGGTMTGGTVKVYGYQN